MTNPELAALARPALRLLIRDELIRQTSTYWRLHSTRHVEHLNVVVAVDTTAREVVDAIEEAAAGAGLVLERIES